MNDKSQFTTMERPKLFASKADNFMAIIVAAVRVAKENGMDADTIRSECVAAGAIKGREVLSRYFEVI